MSDPATLLDGVWQLVRAELGGEAAPDVVTARTTLELRGGRYTVRYGGDVTDRGTFEVGTVVEDHTILLRGTTGPNAGRMIPCAYQLRGDRLRVCFGFDGRAPSEFTTDAHNQRYLATYRRR